MAVQPPPFSEPSPASNPNMLQAFFTANHNSLTSLQQNPFDNKPTASQPAPLDPFKLPVGPDLARLTPTERIFKLGTNVESRGLTVTSGDEFFVFMDMRAKRQWASSKMGSSKWIVETAEYNKELQAIALRSNTPSPIDKYPSALINKLVAVEATISDRLSNPESPNYKSKFIF